MAATFDSKCILNDFVIIKEHLLFEVILYNITRIKTYISPKVVVEWLTLLLRMMFGVVFWDILPCKMIVDRRFRGAYCLHHQGVNKFARQKVYFVMIMLMG
jgi:hypothetical protein